jgi:hypothetical protein
MTERKTSKIKYQVGDLLLIKDICPHLRLHIGAFIIPHLKNTFGIITKVEKRSRENINIYALYSQVDGKEYHFYQDEFDGEVIS